MHGARHRRCRRQVVQPVVLRRHARPRPRPTRTSRSPTCPSNSSNDYTPNLKQEATKKCDTIIAVGGLMADNVKAAAKTNPTPALRRGRRPAVGRRTSTACSSTPRRAGSSAATSRPAYQDRQGRDLRRCRHPAGDDLHGRLLGGRPVLQQGKSKNVQVLGWDENNQKGGTFVPGNNPFGDQNGGQSISQTFINAGRGRHLPGRRRFGPRCRRGSGQAAAARSASSGSTPTAASRPRSTASTS